MEKQYLVTVSGMFDDDYAIDGIEEVPKGLTPIPYSVYLSYESASELKATLAAKYPKYTFKIVQVRG